MKSKFQIPAILILLFVYIIPVYGGQPDTLRVRKNEILFFNDSIVTFDRDTVIIRPPGVAVFRAGDRIVATKAFYDSLKKRTARKKWVGRLYDLLIISDRDAPSQTQKDEKSGSAYMMYEGYNIRDIKIFSLDPFGPVARDTLLKEPGGLQHSLNLLHIKTRDRVIRQNLFIKKGQPINPSLLSDNERILRNLPYIRDARIIVVPQDSGSADILIITRDVFSIAAAYSYSNPEAGKASVYDNNFLGLGHQLKFTGLYDFDDDSPFGWAVNYGIDHIANTFISGNIQLYNAFGQKKAGFNFERDFFSPFVRNAGGISANVAYVHEQLTNDTVIRPLRYFFHDVWYGHSFLLDSRKRNRLVFSGRYYLNNVMERPEIEPFEYHRLQRYQLLLGSISYSQDAYFKTGLIYNFGITEDIPRGILATLTGGYEWNEFENRPYLGAALSFGTYSARNGYFNSGICWGGYMNGEVLTQGTMNVRNSYFSPLIPAGRYYFRQFANLDFTTGIRRYNDEFLTLNDELGVRGFKSDSLTGTRRLALQLETVAFSPFYLYGFRFAFFSFADLGIIDHGDIFFADNKLYSGIGAGVRIRNENLVFNTFQIRLAWYPVLPPETSFQTVVFSGRKLFEAPTFNSGKPDIIQFR